MNEELYFLPDGCRWINNYLPILQLIYVARFVINHTKFSLSSSPEPNLKKEIYMMNWEAPTDLVRRELINIGWDEVVDEFILQNIEASRTALSNGYVWSITFGKNSDFFQIMVTS